MRNMADRDTIDLATASSDDDEEDTSDFPMPSRSTRHRQRTENRKRRGAAAGIVALDVSSSPSLSPARMNHKSKIERKQEALNRAREWHDNRKRGPSHVGRGTNHHAVAAAAASSREVVNLSSPSSPAPASSRRCPPSRDVTTAARSSAQTKMSEREKQEARARAKRWHENRPVNRVRRNNESFRPREVIHLSSPSSSEDSTGGFMDQRNRSNLAHLSTVRSMGESQHSNATRPISIAERFWAASTHQQNDPLSTRPFAASSNRDRVQESQQQEDETQQWACPRCTLLNPCHQPRCDACSYENNAQRHNNRGSNEAMQVYNVDSDGSFILETEQDGNGMSSDNHAFGSVARVSSAESTSRAWYGRSERRHDAMLSGEGASSMGGFPVRERVRQSRPIYGDDGWGRPRNVDSTSFRGGISHSAMAGSEATRNSTFLSQWRHTLMAQRSRLMQMHGHVDNVDDMSYERLLQVFGDGSENRGASSEAISSLPVSKIGDPERELPEDKRECSICLEDFCRGEERTSLPCLHGFHSSCVNRWLSSSGTCPVCKTPVDGSTA